jgi:hypothetical protein
LPGHIFRDVDEEKAARWGEALWKLLRQEISIVLPRSLKGQDTFDFINQRLVNYILTRLVVRGVQIDEETRGLDEETRFTSWAELVEDILDVSAERRDEIAFYISKICSRINRKGGQLTDKQRRVIKRFAKDHGHSCYICGQALTFEATNASQANDNAAKAEAQKIGTDWRTFEIDHLFPQSRGGDRSPDNLAACCNSCNKLKDKNLSYADLLIEKAITSSISEKTIKDVLGNKDMKFALLWKQKGACAMCVRDLHSLSDERLHLIRQNDNDAYHFLNAAIVCTPCNETYQLNGVQIRE